MNFLTDSCNLQIRFQIFPQPSFSSGGRPPYHLLYSPSSLTPCFILGLSLSFSYQIISAKPPAPFSFAFSQREFLFCVQVKSMASEPHVSEVSSLFDRLVRNRDLSLFLPFIFGFSNSSPRRDTEDTDQQPENTESTQPERIILINPFTQGMVVIDGASSLETLFRELGSKGGPPPASKESIESMPDVEIKEGEEDGECVVCLEEWKIGEMAKQMPCKHEFHPNCIEKWLGINGSCPVCRYQMPVEENDLGKKRHEDGGERRGAGREVWVSFSFNGGISRRSEDANEVSSGDSGDAASSPRGDDA